MQKYLPRLYKKEKQPLLKSILLTIMSAFDLLEKDYEAFLHEGDLTTASKFWLNFWGNTFNIPRFPTEQDEPYRKRILTALENGKVTRDAILSFARDFSALEPELVEHAGETLINHDYGDYTYDVHKFLATLTVKTDVSSEDSSQVPINIIPNPETFIRDTVENIKMAGIRIIYNIASFYSLTLAYDTPAHALLLRFMFQVDVSPWLTSGREVYWDGEFNFDGTLVFNSKTGGFGASHRVVIWTFETGGYVSPHMFVKEK